jgi:hypothetical protein
MGDAARFESFGKPRAIEDGAELDIDLVDDIADQRFIAVARIEHRPVAFADEFAACFRADDAHAAGDQNAHGPLPFFCRASRTSARTACRLE